MSYLLCVCVLRVNVTCFCACICEQGISGSLTAPSVMELSIYMLDSYLNRKLELVEQFSYQKGVTKRLTSFHDTNNGCVDLEQSTVVAVVEDA